MHDWRNGSGDRQENPEAGHVSARAVQSAADQIAVVFLHDTLADPQAQAGALGGFGGKERLE